ncbi:MAG: hypothetical protein ACRDOP_00840 [Gaiellaceae bacterium]
MPAVDLELELDAEAELVRSWRIEELERAGYSSGDARHLGELGHVDLHQATSLLRGGCPPDVALRILL